MDSGNSITPVTEYTFDGTSGSIQLPSNVGQQELSLTTDEETTQGPLLSTPEEGKTTVGKKIAVTASVTVVFVVAIWLLKQFGLIQKLSVKLQEKFPALEGNSFFEWLERLGSFKVSGDYEKASLDVYENGKLVGCVKGEQVRDLFASLVDKNIYSRQFLGIPVMKVDFGKKAVLYLKNIDQGVVVRSVNYDTTRHIYSFDCWSVDYGYIDLFLDAGFYER